MQDKIVPETKEIGIRGTYFRHLMAGIERVDPLCKVFVARNAWNQDGRYYDQHS